MHLTAPLQDFKMKVSENCNYSLNQGDIFVSVWPRKGIHHVRRSTCLQDVSTYRASAIERVSLCVYMCVCEDFNTSSAEKV